MAKFEVQSQCEATLELEAHDVWFIKALLDEYFNLRSVQSPHEALGLVPDHPDVYGEDMIDELAQELAKALEGQ